MSSKSTLYKLQFKKCLCVCKTLEDDYINTSILYIHMYHYVLHHNYLFFSEYYCHGCL